MYGPYLTGWVKSVEDEDKPKLHWFTCRPCLVRWTETTKTSHCFVCGKWGTRGVHNK